MTPSVSPTAKTNTHHITLEELDNPSVIYGLIIANNGHAIERRPRQGSNYVPFTQNDWSSGRGLKFSTDDRSRFADSKRLNTRRAGLVSLGGLEQYTTGIRQQEQYTPANASGLTWQALTGSNRFIASKVSPSANGNRLRMYFWIRRRGTPTASLGAWILNNNAGDPGTTIELVAVSTTDIPDTVSQLYEVTLTSARAVTTGTDVWVMVSAGASDDSTNHWEVGVDSAGTPNRTKASASGSAASWSDTSYDLYYRLVDDLDMNGVMYFVYKSQLYCITRPSAGGAPKLYMNGSRGIATGAGQSRTVLQDTTQSWATNELQGRVMLIIDGPNSAWQQPYRVILSNDADEITTQSWGRAHVAGQTVYVILGATTWTEITGHGLTDVPTDVCDAGDILYFAQGHNIKMRRMIERRVGTAWSRSFAEEDNFAKLLLAYRDGARGTMIMKGDDYDNSNRPSVAFAKAEAWGTRLKFPWLINACESTSGWTGGASTVISQETTIYKAGSASIKAAVGAGAANTFAYLAVGGASGISIYQQKKIRLWAYSSAALNPGEVKLRLSTDATAGVNANQPDIDFPAMNAAEWNLVEFPYKNTVNIIKSIGFIKTIATAFDFYIDGIETLPAGSEVPLGNDMERINALELYGDPEVPWVLRTGSVGSIENGTFVPVPLREYAQVENIHNGMGHLVYDVFLYFSFMQGLEEYYRANLDDVGPNKDEGLPEERQGFITSMVGYPDRFLANYDAGIDGYGSVLSRKGGGWHEDYRCDAAGKRIRSLFIQAIPGTYGDRLWVSEGEDILFLSMPGNTINELTDATYRFTHEGVLELPWLGDDQQRLFSSVKLGSENLSSSLCVEWDYKIDEAAIWTPVSTPFTSGPVQTIALNKTGKRLKLRFRLQSNSNLSTPRITSINISTTEQPEPRYSYSMVFQYMDNGRDLLNMVENYTRAETLINKLDEWAENKTPLVMRSQSELYNNKTVFLDPISTGTTAIVWDEQQEKQQGTLTANEPL